MEIPKSAIYNPGTFAYDEKRRKALSDYKDAVHNSKSLNDEGKRRWKLLGYHLSTPQLQRAQTEIIKEDLKKLKITHQLEKLKRTEK